MAKQHYQLIWYNQIILVYHSIQKHKPVLIPVVLVAWTMLKAARGLDAATLSFTSAGIPAAMLLAMLSDVEILGGGPNGWNK